MTNLLAYVPIFFLIELFKRTSNRKSKSKQLENVIKGLKGSEKVNLVLENQKVSSKEFKLIPFPWWFKLILYGISFVCMALSIFLITLKGNFNIIKF